LDDENIRNLKAALSLTRNCNLFELRPRKFSLLYNGYRVFTGGKERPGRDAEPSPPSSAVFMKV